MFVFGKTTVVVRSPNAKFENGSKLLLNQGLTVLFFRPGFCNFSSLCLGPDNSFLCVGGGGICPVYYRKFGSYGC